MILVFCCCLFQIETIVIKYDNVIDYANKLDVEKTNTETFIISIEQHLLQWENAESNQLVDDEINTIMVCLNNYIYEL